MYWDIPLYDTSNAYPSIRKDTIKTFKHRSIDRKLPRAKVFTKCDIKEAEKESSSKEIEHKAKKAQFKYSTQQLFRRKL